MKQIGNKIVRLDSVDSTNNFAANLLREGKIGHGTVILADEQTAGRGQRGASWHSQGGMNLIFSVFVEHDNLSVDQQAQITHWVALSVNDLLRAHDIESLIKWPNDLLVGDEKIGGILIENQLSGTLIRSSIIGVGLNVNQQFFEQLQATSMRLCTHIHYDIQEIGFGLIEALNKRVGQFGGLQFDYHRYLWKINECVNFYRNGATEQGVLLGTDVLGRLRMLIEGEEQTFDLKEISFFGE